MGKLRTANLACAFTEAMRPTGVLIARLRFVLLPDRTVNAGGFASAATCFFRQKHPLVPATTSVNTETSAIFRPCVFVTGREVSERLLDCHPSFGVSIALPARAMIGNSTIAEMIPPDTVRP